MKILQRKIRSYFGKHRGGIITKPKNKKKE